MSQPNDFFTRCRKIAFNRDFARMKIKTQKFYQKKRQCVSDVSECNENFRRKIEKRGKKKERKKKIAEGSTSNSHPFMPNALFYSHTKSKVIYYITDYNTVKRLALHFQFE